MPLMARTASQTPDIPPALLARVAREERVIVRKGRKAVQRRKPGQGIRSARPTRSEVEAIREARREMQEKNTVPAERLFRELGL